MGTLNRRLRLGFLTALASCVAAFLSFVLLQALHQPNNRVRWDWAGHGFATLSDRTAAALAELPTGSKATLFLIPEEESFLFNGAAVYPRAFSLLRTALADAEIRSRGQLQVTVLDLSSAPVDLDSARKRLNRQVGESLVIETDEGRQVISFRDLFTVDAPTSKRPARLNSQRIDEAIGDAAVRLAQNELLRVAVLSSQIPGLSADPRALRPFVHLLESEGYVAETVSKVPALEEGFDLLVIPGQREDFQSSDQALIQEWIRGDMPLALGLGFSAPQSVADFWNESLAGLGVEFAQGLVCQKWRGNFGDSRCANEVEVPPSRLQERHPITSQLRLAQRGLEFQALRPLSLLPSAENYLRDQLIWMDKNAWVETEQIPDFAPGPSERRGPFPIVVSAQPMVGEKAAMGRIFLMGTAAPFYGGSNRHRDFLAAALRWLLGEELRQSGLVALESLPYRPSERIRARLGNLSLFAIPGIALLLAFLVRWKRKQ